MPAAQGRRDVLGRQASDKLQGRKPRPRLSASARNLVPLGRRQNFSRRVTKSSDALLARRRHIGSMSNPKSPDGKPTSSREQVVAKARRRFAEADIEIADLKEKGAQKRRRQEELKRDQSGE
jgi:hypothetical protein